MHRPYPFQLGIAFMLTALSLPLRAQTPATQPADAINAKLESRMDIKLTGLTAERAVLKLQEDRHINLLVDWDGLKDKGLTRTQELTGQLSDVTVREAIQVILSEGGCTEPLQIARDGNLLRISGPPVVETKVLPIGKLLDRLLKELTTSPPSGVTVPPGPADAIDKLVRLIQEQVDADTWRDNGGTAGSISILGRRMVVTQTPATITKVEKLLQELEKDDAK